MGACAYEEGGGAGEVEYGYLILLNSFEMARRMTAIFFPWVCLLVMRSERSEQWRLVSEDGALRRPLRILG